MYFINKDASYTYIKYYRKKTHNDYLFKLLCNWLRKKTYYFHSMFSKVSILLRFRGDCWVNRVWFSFIAAGTPSIGASSRLSSPRHSNSSPHHGSPRFTHHDMEWEDEFEFYDEGAPSRGCRRFLLLSLSCSCVASWPDVVVFFCCHCRLVVTLLFNVSQCCLHQKFLSV